MNDGADITIPANSYKTIEFDVTDKIPSGYGLLGKYPYIRWHANGIAKDVSFSSMSAYNTNLSCSVTLFSNNGATVNIGVALICQKY